MLLYSNGDSHAAAAEAVNPCAWACDDGEYGYMGRRAHPDNERVSYSRVLADELGSMLCLDAQAGGSNARIMRTAREWIQLNPSEHQSVFMVLQWSTWERQEWWLDGQDYQVNASGIDHVPEAFAQRYRQYIADIDWRACTENAHQEIWRFHQELQDLGIRHLMFNGNSHFGSIQKRCDWQNTYIAPYEAAGTFDQVLRSQGFRPVTDQSWHFGAEAHCFWAHYLLTYINNNQLLGPP